MNHDNTLESVKRHWERLGLGQAILNQLGAIGKNLDSLSIDDLAPFDQFHGGSKEMTLQLAHMAGLKRGMRVLDVGGGLGGPARTLATEYGCNVTVADLTESYVQAGQMLTERLRLQSQVKHVMCDALELPFSSGSFDVVWTQNSGMNIQDKPRLYTGFLRVLVPGGMLLIQEPMAGAMHPPLFPVMWAQDETTSFLLTPDEMRKLIEGVGFVVSDWQDVTVELMKLKTMSEASANNIQSLVMGAELEKIKRASKRNIEENRIVMVQAVFRSKNV